MLKRALKIGLAVSIGLATLHGVTAEAGGWTYVRPPGTWWYYGSIDGCGLVQQVKNPDRFPARLACDVTVTRVESLCINPADHPVTGEAATQVVYSAVNPIGDNDLLNDKSRKTKGKAGLCVSITNADSDCPNADNPLCTSENCVNPNWTIQRVMTSEFETDCKTQACASTIVDSSGTCCTTAGVTTDTVTLKTTCIMPADWVTKDTQTCVCSLPAPYSIENPPDHKCKHPLDPEYGCVAYDCYDVVTGYACGLD